MKRQPHTLAPVAKALVLEVFNLRVQVSRWLVTTLAVVVAMAVPVAVQSPNAPGLEPLEPAVPLLEASVDAGLPSVVAIPPPGPNQKRAGTCDPGRSQVELNGGCWVQTTHAPPCPYLKQWEHKGACWLPVAPAAPVPTSGDAYPVNLADPP